MTVAEVILWGTKIGTIVFDDYNRLGAFEYDSEFLRSGIEVSPIVMPLSRRVYTFPELSKQSFHGLPGLLADSLPDKFGNAVINAWLQGQGRSPESFNPVERLCYTGNRGMGALEYVPARGPVVRESEKIELEKLVQLASDILGSRENMHLTVGENSIQEIIRVGSSAGGARAKAVIAWNEKTGDIRSGQIEAEKGYGYWLIKFDGVEKNGDKEGEDVVQYTRIEYAYYLMAKDAGILMNECRLYEEKGRYHFMTRRFDRNPVTGGKIHMQSLGGLAHFDFNQPGAYSYEQAVRVMHQIRLSNQEIAQFYRRMVFNVLARNQDDHVKNISFLMERNGDWHLAPAYDVTYAYNPEGMWTGSHQMTVNGKREDITRGDLLACAKSMGLKKTNAEQIIEDVGKSISEWEKFADKANLKNSLVRYIAGQFVKL